MEKKLLFRDQAGNTLWTEYIKTRGTKRLVGKNAQGRVLDKASLKILVDRKNKSNRSLF